MINSSLYFYGNGEDCRNYGIINVSKQTGLFEQSLFAEREIVEVENINTDIPYFQKVSKRPLQFSLRLFFIDGFSLEDLRRLRSWLDVDMYIPIIFSDDMDRIYYAMPINSPVLSHNGYHDYALSNGYIDIDFRCDSPYSYTEIITTEWIDYSANSAEGSEVTIFNTGDFEDCPFIEIEKVGNGDVKLINLSNNNQEMKFTGLVDGEILKIDGSNEDIVSSLPNTYRYDNHNEVYTTLVLGQNDIMVYGNVKIRFTTQFRLRG